MKKIAQSLPVRLLAGVIIGIAVGLISNESFMNIIVTVKHLLGQVITFCVPLIVIGFIAPSITRLGKSASRMLSVALVLAYTSSVGAALSSMAAGYTLIPHLSIVSSVDGLKELPEVIFALEIPQIMSVMSALVFSVLVGLAVTWTKAERTAELLEEFQKIVLEIVTRVIIPILPLFIACTFCSLAYEGTITRQLPVFLKVIIIVMIGHFIWMALLYGLAGAYSGKNPMEVIKHYGPAYITAVGTMSSAATLAVRYPAVCQYPSVRICSDRSLLRYDRIPDSVRLHSFSGNHGTLLPAPWCLCHWRSGCTWRNGYGILRTHYRHPAL